MNKSNSIVTMDGTNLINQEKFKLNGISKFENYFNKEIKERKLNSKKLSQYVASFDYIDKILIVLRQVVEYQLFLLLLLLELL